MYIAKQKQVHRYRKQTGAWKRGEGMGGKLGVRD